MILPCGHRHRAYDVCNACYLRARAFGVVPVCLGRPVRVRVVTIWEPRPFTWSAAARKLGISRPTLLAARRAGRVKRSSGRLIYRPARLGPPRRKEGG